ncbi:hypothetical protein FZC79_18680 [Rossellomorea vietnamensis]|uniref:Uncharacterized protein n=1 Tax=Rossellomorea vietnamensis TaxID=218284 RepID=A0A5D4K859_9BACI|nr:hypothetical protein [Rossellomorea vietnamensis]TYR73468.1 hypothetical protein FZC79_18680 [Rossellomorea vietnamensis]
MKNNHKNIVLSVVIPLVIIGGLVIAFVMALPFIGVLGFTLFTDFENKSQEEKTTGEVQEYLTEKYDGEFVISVESSFELGTEIEVYPKNHQDYSFYVERNYNSTDPLFHDELIYTIAKKKLMERVAADFPESYEDFYIKNIVVTNKDWTVNVDKELPKLEELPVKMDVLLKGESISKELDLEHAWLLFNKMKEIVQSHEGSINQVAIKSVYPGENGYKGFKEHHFIIPIEKLDAVKTSEDLLLFKQ